jgi:hypothetical protein
MRGLRREGVQAGWHEPDAAPPSVLVVSKRYDDASLAAIEQLRARGTRIVADFCDNSFVAALARQSSLRRIEGAARLLRLADAVVASTPALAEVLRDQNPSIDHPHVIGDLPDDLTVVPRSGWRMPFVRLRLAAQLRSLRHAKQRGCTRLLWFGHHGGRRAQSGYPDLARVLPLLDALHQTRRVQLSVISDNRRGYNELIRGHAIPSRYFEWDAVSFDPLAAEHDIALIPATLNAYTRCKTDNRLVTALRAGLGVVADPLPSYEPFAGSVSLGDFHGSVLRYMDDPALRAEHVRRGREQAAALAAAAPVIQGWRRVLQS